jgi:hypothetical protein
VLTKIGGQPGPRRARRALEDVEKVLTAKTANPANPAKRENGVMGPDMGALAGSLGLALNVGCGVTWIDLEVWCQVR